MIVALIVACTSPDPDLRAKRAAVDAFDQAKAQLEAGDAAGARAAFAAMPAVHPVVKAWEARAAAAAGDLEGAVAILDLLLAQTPDFGLARYNRAAYRARLGQLEGAAEDLTLALEVGATTLREATVDPDFAPHLEHPAFAVIAANALIVAVEPPPTSTFLGSEVRLTLRITGAGGRALSVTSPAAQGPVTFVEHVEAVTDPLQGRTLTWAWRVDGPGTVVLEPITVTNGTVTMTTSGARVEAAAPPGRGDPTSRPIAFPIASQVAEGLADGVARWVDGRLQVKLESGDRLIRRPSGPPPRRFTFRERRVTSWVVEEHPDEPAIVAIERITGTGKTEPVAIPDRPGASPTGD
ncbi:MAG: tetratricopeptide repeat protein [Myxococcota bacterium]